MDTDSTNSKTNYDGEENKSNIPYPKSVFFIVSNEFCERFSYYGMRTILVIYLTNILRYSEADAKVVYHTFAMFVYFFPLLGAIISDSWLGKFRTILYVSMIYAAGSILLGLASAEPVGLPQKPFSILGLLLIAIGTGGIKPCVSAFGGDQFIIPEQELQLVRFFSFFYFAINAGSLISTFLTPVLRNDVHCFDKDSCFSLAFAVPGALMILSIVIFAAGKSMYKIKKPEGNIIVKVAKCITYALTHKGKSKDKKEHWLDYSEEKFGPKLVSDIKMTLHVLVLYIPLPIFWALYDQQGSGWTFQAVRMDGEIGFFTILPDQMQVVNPLLILAFIPLFTYGLYPFLAKCNFLTTPLQRMTCGGFLAAVAFAVSACVSIALESTYPVLPTEGNIQLRLYNPSNCQLKFNVDVAGSKIIQDAELPPLGYWEKTGIDFKGTQLVDFEFSSINCTLAPLQASKQVNLTHGTAYGLYMHDSYVVVFEDDIAKSEDGYPRIRTLTATNVSITYTQGSESIKVEPGNYTLKSAPNVGKYKINGGQEVEFKLGGTYTVVYLDGQFNRVTVTNPNSVHMLWLLPQYFIITAAEIMFSITGLEFSYSQAPVNMKSLLQACFLLTTAIGNLLIVIIESAKIFDKQSNDFFLYTGLMVADMLLFGYMAMRYKYVNVDDNEEEELSEEMDKPKTNGIDNPSFTPNGIPKD